MPPPSPLAIATSSVRRLLKEEASYHKELEDEEVKVKDLEEKIQNGEAGDDENNDYLLRQLKLSIEQTKAVFGPLKERIAEAVDKLEGALKDGQESGVAGDEIEQAKTVLAQSKATQNGA